MKTLQVFRMVCQAAAATALLSGVAHADIASGVVRKKVAGIDLIVYRTGVQDVVTMSGALPGGEVFAGAGNPAVPAMVADMLDRGTTRQGQFQIAAKLEQAGASLDFGADAQMVTVTGRMVKQDLALIIDLMAEQLRYPAFLPAELEKLKQLSIGNRQQQMQDPGEMALEAFASAVFPSGHPNRPVTAKHYLESIPRITAQELKAFHAKHYGPRHMTLVFVGDVDPAQVEAQVASAFAGWSGGVPVIRAQTTAPQATTARELPVQIPGKTSTSILLGQASGLDVHHPDALALEVGTAILGSGFTGRLMGTVRDQEGLTYGIGASVGRDMFGDGAWTINATFAPDLLAKGVSSTRRELEKWWQEGVTAEELEARKTNLIGAYQVSLSTTGGAAQALMRAAHLGYEVSWLDEYPRRIQALTLIQVNAALREHLDPARMVLVKAGTLATAAPDR